MTLHYKNTGRITLDQGKSQFEKLMNVPENDQIHVLDLVALS